jgi:hypothetical protein
MILSHEQVDNNCLDKFGMDRHQIIHYSGHARSPDLFRIVSGKDAGVLFPVHTESPEMYVRATKKDGSGRRGRDVRALIIHCGNDFFHARYAPKALHNLLHSHWPIKKSSLLNILMQTNQVRL